MNRHNISKKLWGWLAAMAFAVAFTQHLHADQPELLDIHVSINANKSVSAGTTYYNFGALAVNTSSVSATALVITNDAVGLTETYTMMAGNAISDTVGTDWSLQTSSSGLIANQYAIAAQFGTGRPADDDIAFTTDYLSGTPVACGTNQFGNGAPLEAGASVAPSGVRNLWFRIHTPPIVADPTGHTALITLAVQ